MSAVKRKTLRCGHPGAPQNLKDGKCGTCSFIAELEGMDALMPKLRRKLRQIARQARRGKLVYDTNGKTLLEWERLISATPRRGL